MTDNATKRRNAVSIRCAKLRRDGYTIGEIAAATGIDRAKLAERIKLGERLLQLDTRH